MTCNLVRKEHNVDYVAGSITQKSSYILPQNIYKFIPLNVALIYLLHDALFIHNLLKQLKIHHFQFFFITH